MRWCDILTEDATAPLFHSTTLSRLVQILRDDALKPTTESHPLPRAFRRGGRPADWRHENLVFLTRSFEFARDWEPCVLVLDQSRLRQRYRVKPLDPLALRRSLDHHKNAETGAIPQNRRMVGRWDAHPIAFPLDETAEVVEGTITPLSRYLLSIWVPYHVRNTLDRKPDTKEIVAKHPAYMRPFPGSIHTNRYR